MLTRDDPIYQPTSEHAGVDTDDETSTNMSLVKDYIESHKLVKQRAQVITTIANVICRL